MSICLDSIFLKSHNKLSNVIENKVQFLLKKLAIIYFLGGLKFNSTTFEMSNVYYFLTPIGKK